MSGALDLAIAKAVEAGILPAGAALPRREDRPWPVMVLTGLGAWLAAVPLCFGLGLLLNDMFDSALGPYLIGLLVLGAAVVLLRVSDMPLFFEQLAVCGLAVGSGCIAYGLFRDLDGQGGTAVLAVLTLGIAIAIPRPWLRILMGLVAAVLTATALSPGVAYHGHGYYLADWMAVHVVLALGVAALVFQHSRLNHDVKVRLAAILEPVAAGWLASVLILLALLVRGSSIVGSTLHLSLPYAPGDVLEKLYEWLAPISLYVPLVLALAASILLARAWPALRKPWYVPLALVMVVLAWFQPTLGGVLLALALTATTGRFRLAILAALCAVWTVASFYYDLKWDLATKAALLAGCGAVLGAVAWFTHFRYKTRQATRANVPALSALSARTAHILISLCAIATLAVVNLGIWQKERLIAQGKPVFVELQPVDPRSLMQGDYMRLDFRLPFHVVREHDASLTTGRPSVVARRDERGVAEMLRLYDRDEPLTEGEFRIELTRKNGRWIFVTDAWFFREGDGARWEAARFGEFRVDKNGKALLVGMADAELRAIAP